MQTQDRPVFRQDLVAEAIEEQGAKFIDVMDPDSGNVFRFFEVEYSLACAMDGQRDVAGIVKWAQEELGLTPSPKEVQSVIATLADLKFIETGATRLSDVPEAKAQAQSRGGGGFDSEATTIGSSPIMDEDLAPGIVVGAAARAPASQDVELGHAGTAKSAPVKDDMPKADFDLGAPGAAASPARPQKVPVEDVALGASGARESGRPVAAAAAKPAADLSMDLSLDLPVKASDVKEAVRASKVMSAVDVPKELQDELDRPAAKPAAKAAEKAPAAAKAAEKAPVAAKAAEKAPVAAKAAEKAPVAAKKPAVELPSKAPNKQPVAPPAPRQSVNPVLVVLLILAVVGAGAFAFWKFVLSKPDAGESTQQQPPAPPPPPPAPTEATSKVALDTPPAQELKAPAGTLETVVADGMDVKSGDVLVTLTGAKALTTELANIQKDIDKGTPTIEAAQKELADAQQKENNAAGVTAAQAKLDRTKKPIDDKKAALAKKQADLDKLTLKAQTDGKLATTAKVGQKVVADEVIGTVVRATVPTATFKIPPTVKLAADGNVSLTAGDKTVVCTVTDAQTESIKVTCPADSGLASGADVKFKFPR